MLFLKNEKHAARNTCTIALCGIKFFFQHTLGREWKTLDFSFNASFVLLLAGPLEKILPVHSFAVRLLQLVLPRLSGFSRVNPVLTLLFLIHS